MLQCGVCHHQATHTCMVCKCHFCDSHALDHAAMMVLEKGYVLHTEIQEIPRHQENGTELK
jgi:hypothetical protein